MSVSHTASKETKAAALFFLIPRASDWMDYHYKWNTIDKAHKTFPQLMRNDRCSIMLSLITYFDARHEFNAVSAGAETTTYFYM